MTNDMVGTHFRTSVTVSVMIKSFFALIKKLSKQLFCLSVTMIFIKLHPHTLNPSYWIKLKIWKSFV